MFNKRIEIFQQSLDGNADMAFIPVSADLQYLTGLPREFPNFGNVMHPGAWIEGMWLTPDLSPIFILSRMTAEFGGMNKLVNGDMRILGDWDDPFSMAKDVFQRFTLSDNVTVAVSDKTEAETLVSIQKLIPNATFISATDILRPLRAVKSEVEIETMRKAGQITENAFEAVIKSLKHGMTELDVMAEVDYQLKKHGALGPSFNTAMYNTGPNHPLIFGQNETKWHRTLKPPMSLLFDFGAIFEGFCYDFGRTVSFGEPSQEFIDIHALVMASQQAGIEALISDKHTAQDADRAARQVIADAGQGGAFRHRLGHGIGLDVHEPPFLTEGDETPLKTGMLFTVEPSILYEEGFSARVEDVVMVTPSGGQPLTTRWKDLVIVE